MFRFLLVLNVLTTIVLAQESQDISQVVKGVSYEPNYFGLIFGLFTVVVLIYLTGFIYQKLIRVKICNTDNNVPKINVLTTASVGQGRNLHIVKIGDKNILIGATQTNITYITDVDCEKELGGNENDKSN